MPMPVLEFRKDRRTACSGVSAAESFGSLILELSKAAARSGVQVFPWEVQAYSKAARYSPARKREISLVPPGRRQSMRIERPVLL